VFTASNLQVVRVDTSTGLESPLFLTTDYTVSLNADQDSNPGGSLTLLAVLATGFNMIITSDIANLQPTDLTNQGGFYPEVITDALDRATIQIQQMADELTRSIKIPVTDGLSLDMELPTAAARANSFLAFDATGEPTVVTAGSSGAPTTITRQQFSGTGSQVAYTLASDPGALGNSCEVFVGGIYQQRDTYTIAGTTLTFTAAPVAGTDNIEVVNFLTTAIGATDSSLVTYIPAGAGATQRTVQAKLRDVVSVNDFGAVGNGVADDTIALNAAFDYAIPLSLPVVLRGTYRITGPLQTAITRTSGELHIICDGDVKINVDASSTAFTYVMLIQRSTVTNVSITGGSLTVDCANKAAYAFYLRHLDTVQGGTCSINLPTTILNVKQNTAAQNAAGVAVYGDFIRIDLNDITVIGVERVGAGVCRGIEVGLFAGDVTIRRPYIKNVLCPASSLQDADGIATSGKAGADVNLDARAGRVVIESPTFVDCQGRSYKSQCSNDTIISPYVFRKNVVTIANGYDFDFQFGGGTVISPVFEYRLNGGTSPLGASFAPFGFQNRIQDKELSAFVTGSRIVTDVAMEQFANLLYSTTAKSSTVTINGLDILPSSAIATAVLTRAICRVSDMEFVATMPGTATIVVCNIQGPIDAAGIGYTGYTGGSIASKLQISVSNIRNTLGTGSFTSALYVLSGTRILALNKFNFLNNHSVTQTIANTGSGLQNFDFANLEVGTTFTLGLNNLGTITNAPPWEASTDGKAFVEVLMQGAGAFAGTKIIRVTTVSDTGNRSKVFLSRDNATTWIQLGGCTPVTKTADFTVAANEDVLINNKSGSACVVTLPAASSWSGRRIVIKTIQAQAVNSASSNVVPLAGGAAGTAILTGTAGKYAEFVSDGTNWVIMSAN
jgi:hypothetical protein